MRTDADSHKEKKGKVRCRDSENDTDTLQRQMKRFSAESTD